MAQPLLDTARRKAVNGFVRLLGSQDDRDIVSPPGYHASLALLGGHRVVAGVGGSPWASSSR